MTIYYGQQITKPQLDPSGQDLEYGIQFHPATPHLLLGMKRLASSLLWIWTLLHADHEHYRGKEYHSFLYQKFYFISLLDPLFLENYQYGGQFLSIIKDDLKAAERLFQLGLTHYPVDYFLNYHLAFLYFHEQKSYAQAIPLLATILKHHRKRAPPYLDLLMASLLLKTDPLQEEEGQRKALQQQLLRFLEESLAQTAQDPVFQQRYRERIEQVKKAWSSTTKAPTP